MSIIHNGKNYGVETIIKQQEGFDIITDDNGSPVYIKAKSTTTSVDLSNCTALVELDLSDADMEDVICGEYGNVNIRQCSALQKVTWPTKMKHFATYSDGLYNCTSLNEIPTVTGYVNLSGTNIKEVTIGNRQYEEGFGEWWGNFSGCENLSKINKAWDGDEKYMVDVHNCNSLVNLDFNSFKTLTDTDGMQMKWLMDGYSSSYGDYFNFGDLCILIPEMYFNAPIGYQNVNNAFCCEKLTLGTGWTWDEGGQLHWGDNFRNFLNLKDLYIMYDGAGVPKRNEGMFMIWGNSVWVKNYELTIHVPASLLEAYKADETWADYKDQIVAI